MPRVNSLTPEKRAEDDIYRKIKAAMAFHNYKQNDIADLLNLHKTTISQHFRNRTFSFYQLLQIAEFMDLEFSICAK